MYHAHSKDINRNKSFHPLTYGNLRRVELLKEGEEDKKARASERQKELQRDQEERRYDDLILTNSTDSVSGEMARLRQTRGIFKAEYEMDTAKEQQHAEASAKEEKAGPSSSSALAASPFTSSANSFLSKFKKEGQQQSASTNAHDTVKPDVKAEAADEAVTTSPSSGAHGKRPREKEEEEKTTAPGVYDKSTKNTPPNVVATGFVTSAEAAQLRQELNLAQKQRVDPLMSVRQYQNTCVAAAARQHEHQRQADTLKDGKGDDALQSRIRELLALKKKKT